MDLMEPAPQEVDFMAPTMPPIKHKGRDKVGDGAAGKGRNVFG
jgi:hypothetical protein